jgi:hypothetical protein
MFINIVYFNIRARITRTQALRLLPSASASDIDALVDLIAINGKKLSDFWMHENGLVAYGQAESLVFVTKSAPWKYHNRPYIYEIQASEFAQCYPNASLHKDDLHNLCAHLYFNWAIEALVIETDKVVITLRRRGEAKKLQYKKETSNANEQDQFKKMAPLTK